jgi:uncharacterized RDD family membrane protein YckC
MAEAATGRHRQEADMRRRLVTPEGVDLGLTLASGSQRMAAFMLDCAIMLGILIAMSLIVFVGLVSGGASIELLAMIWLLGFFVLRNGYFIILEMGPRAATLGKRIAGLRVVARSGGRLTADAVIARNLMREIEVFLPLSFLGWETSQGGVDSATAVIGLAWACLFLFFPLTNRDRLRIGDLLAGTWVISVPTRQLTVDLMRRGETEGEPSGQAPPQAGYSFTEEQLEAYGIYELQTLERVLRGGNFDAMSTVAWTIRNKIGYGEVESSEEFLAAYYEALRRRLERKLLFGRRRADKHDR